MKIGIKIGIIDAFPVPIRQAVGMRYAVTMEGDDLALLDVVLGGTATTADRAWATLGLRLRWGG